MARINIEDELFRDTRFTELAIKFGSRTMALGALVEAFILAQEHYLNTENERLIPLKDWNRLKVGEELVATGWAQIREFGVYVSGSKENFGWLIQRSEAGKHSAAAKKSKNESTTVEDRSTTVNGSQPLPLTPSLPLTLSLAPPLSPSQEDKTNNTVPASKSKKKEPSPLNLMIWESYANAYRKRYETEPPRNARVNATISQIAARLGTEGIQVVDFFVKHNDGFYLKKTHSIGLCLADAETLMVQMKRGQAITSTTVRSFEKTQATRELFEQIDRGAYDTK